MENKVVLMTGASGGIGSTTCEYLSARGFRVYGVSRHPSGSTPGYRLLQADISAAASVAQTVRTVTGEAGRIDVLINNAGYSYCGSLIDISLDEMIGQYNVNVFGAMRMIQAVVPGMLERGSGMIVNIGSIGGRMPLPYQAAYSSSKAALMNLTDSLKIELLKDGIRVCLIEPGDTRTAFHDRRVYTEDFAHNKIARRSIDIMQKSEARGIAPSAVARVIHKAITSRNPKQRYVVGSDAALMNFLNRLLPSGIRRRIIMNLYKVPGK